MKSNILILLFSLYIFSCGHKNISQTSYKSDEQKIIESNLLQYFQFENSSERKVSKDSLFYTEYEDNNFVLSIHDSILPFEYNQQTLNNPYFSEKFEDSDEKKIRVKNFPKSYSVIYFNHLISLFENGKFVCFNLKNFERNLEFEKQINTSKFDYHWLINAN